jgi:hypothetical protein
VIQVRHCRSGPPLLPTYDADGSLSWVVSADPYLRFDTYLAITLERLTGKSWSHRISQHLHDVKLVNYQAVVKQEDWRELWDTLMKPFGEQRMAYRHIHRVPAGPDIYFGVEAKPSFAPENQKPGKTELTESTGDQADASLERVDLTSCNEETTASSGSARSSSPEINPSGPFKDQQGDGIQLPKAADWLDFWQNTGIPQQRTFVDFAQHVNEREFRRTMSLPDLANHEDFEESGVVEYV